MSDDALLTVDRVSRYFGGLRALHEVSLAVPRQSIFALIGPNGSGKTTLFNVITGLLPPTSGSLIFNGRPIGGGRAHHTTCLRVRRGLQNNRPFLPLCRSHHRR